MAPARPKSISLTILRLVALLSGLSLLALGGLWLTSDLLRFEAEMDQLRANYLETRKAEVKNQIDLFQAMIAEHRVDLERNLRHNLRQRVLEAWTVADSLYRHNIGRRHKTEVATMIREALRPIRYNNGRGYFFATKLDGTEELFADQPQLEGVNLLHAQDLRVKTVIRDMIDIARGQGEGFIEYLWTKPNSQGRGHRKLTFIKYFPQLDWLIGSGEYVDDAEADLGQEILRLMEYHQFGDKGYIFACTLDGQYLSGPFKGSNLFTHTDINPRKVIEQLTETAKKGGGFVEYIRPASKGEAAHRKVSFITPVTPWGWFMGAGVNVEAVDNDIAKQRARLWDDVRQRSLALAVLLSLVLAGQYILARWASERLQDNLDGFMAAFREAEASGARLAPESLPYVELKNLALSANAMIEARAQAERALRDSETRYRRLVDNAHDAIFLFNHNGQILDANRVACDQLESGPDALSSLSIWDIDQTSSPEHFKAMRQRLHEKNSAMVVSTFRRGDGSTFPAEIHLTLFQEDGRDLVLGIARDITERQHAEERLRQSEAKFVHLFQSSPDAIILSHLGSARITEVNTACAATFGRSREDMLGHTTKELGLYQDPSRREAILKQLDTEKSIQNQSVEIRRADGAVLTCLLSSQVLLIDGEEHAVTTFHDITEQKKIQEMMIQTEKMMSVGGIAAGIAHEINNPLGIILQTAQNLALRTRPDFPRNQKAAEEVGLDLTLMERYMKARKLDVFIEQIQIAGARAATIIRNMLDFSRRSEAHRGQCDVRSIIEKSIALAESDYDLKKSYDFRQIQIDIVEHGEIPAITCTETEIEQVVLNILRNAAQAMGAQHTKSPRIAIHMSGTDQGVRIEIEDNGPGMQPEVQRRIFEPFFTTKKPGEGTGLGLSVSYFIITQGHGGTISVTSQPGHGSCFTIDLPTRPEPMENETRC